MSRQDRTEQSGLRKLSQHLGQKGLYAGHCYLLYSQRRPLLKRSLKLVGWRDFAASFIQAPFFSATGPEKWQGRAPSRVYRWTSQGPRKIGVRLTGFPLRESWGRTGGATHLRPEFLSSWAPVLVRALHLAFPFQGALSASMPAQSPSPHHYRILPKTPEGKACMAPDELRHLVSEMEALANLRYGGTCTLTLSPWPSPESRWNSVFSTRWAQERLIRSQYCSFLPGPCIGLSKFPKPWVTSGTASYGMPCLSKRWANRG